jgi:hypothetical protein
MKLSEHPIEPPARARGGGAKARSAIVDFARAWTNWTWRSIGESARERAAVAAGELRERVLVDGEDARSDRTLARDRVVNRGEVLAADVRQRGGRAYAFVVVRETNSRDGIAALGDTVLRVYRAELRRDVRAGRWFVTEWEDAA